MFFTKKKYIIKRADGLYLMKFKTYSPILKTDDQSKHADAEWTISKVRALQMSKKTADIAAEIYECTVEEA
jgi:hypothetical protein